MHLRLMSPTHCGSKDRDHSFVLKLRYMPVCKGACFYPLPFVTKQQLLFDLLSSYGIKDEII